MLMFLLFLAFFILFTKPAHAYLDPGTGSYIFQVAVATFLASGYFLRNKLSDGISLLKKVTSKFTSKKKEDDK
ncbi:MAG: hypothetical protein ACMG6E_01860 [Candidatus Roizmanbacteria bacterium]